MNAAGSRTGSTWATAGTGPAAFISSFHQRTRSVAAIGGHGLSSCRASRLNFRGARTFSGNFIASITFVATTSRIPAASRTWPSCSYTASSTITTSIPASSS